MAKVPAPVVHATEPPPVSLNVPPPEMVDVAGVIVPLVTTNSKTDPLAIE
jgi:hypothetical protein